ncbi:MAG TPA: hypothetical protein VMT16_15420 [Thermoanaerobaculia bacterium]|nr:hypothetical protein [Thermoanaerobaculia bacterium]
MIDRRRLPRPAAALAPLALISLLACDGAFPSLARQAGGAAAPAVAGVTARPAAAVPARAVRGVSPETLLAALPAGAEDDGAFAAHRAEFTLRLRGHESPYRLMSLFVLPGETVPVEVVRPRGAFQAAASDGELRETGAARWEWTAPQTTGRHGIVVQDRTSGEAIRLNAFVLVPYRGEERLGSYPIGEYMREPLKGDPAYAMPGGLIEVGEQDLDIWISPHFRLGQFLCKQDAPFPKYALVQEKLLLKLEGVLEGVNARGVEADTFFVMSGYRTPFYNAAIGNQTGYSRHHYGDAADVYVDQDGDGWMDDVNGDGRVDEADARFLYELVEELEPEPHFHGLDGGLGLYRANAVRPPFVHIDTRGHRARW